MDFVDHQFVSLLIRWIHVASVANLLGGAFLLLILAWREIGGATRETSRSILVLARTYEAVFWVTLGLIVATGIGNLGAFGTALPGTQSAWGVKFIIKMSVVTLLILFSIARSFFIVSLDAHTTDFKSPFQFAQFCYGITAALMIAILFLAVSLAHA